MLMNDEQKASRLISGFLICVIGLMCQRPNGQRIEK